MICRHVFLILQLHYFIVTAKQIDNSTVLSRKRRYLVFPEGSSFQVVFDLTYPSVAIEGNVFMFGHTAAMAWELPSTPIFLDKEKMLKQDISKSDEKAETTTVSYHQYYGWEAPASFEGPLNTLYYKNAYVYKPSHIWDRTSLSRRFDDRTQKRSITHHIQRRSRRELYRKLEKLLTALSKNGKACVLKAICQVKKLSSKKGTFWEEILKAIFKSKFDNHPDDDHYDLAANEGHDCEAVYPECEGHVLSSLFKNKS